MTSWDELLERNQDYARNKHKPQPFVSELTRPIAPQFFIFSCIDFRVPVEEFLGIKSEEALIVRTAGGRMKSRLTDLLFVDTLTQGKALRDVIVIHHTDCGFTRITDDGVKDILKAKFPHLSKEIDPLYFGTFGSNHALEESVREDLEFLKSHPLIRQEIKDNAKGYVYDIKSGMLNAVH